MPDSASLVIHAIGCGNYKPFLQAELHLSPLTLLFGHNTSGKSALARLPRLVLHALSGQIELSVATSRFGLRFVDLVHGRDPHGAFSLRVDATLDGARLDATTTWQILSSVTGASGRFVREFHVGGGRAFDLSWQPGLEPGAFQQSQGAAVRFSGLLPHDPVGGLDVVPEVWRRAAADALSRLIYLGPHRAALAPSYVQTDDAALEDDGRGAAHWLRNDPDLAHAVATWYRTHLDVDLDVDPQGDAFRLVVRSGAYLLNAVELGEGAQQVLPIVTLAQALILGRRTPSLVIIEQPELHLHDAAQGAVADLLLRAARSTPAPLLVETHSEISMLRIRRRIAEGADGVCPDEVGIYWVERNDGVSTATRMQVEADGWVEGWPRTVYDVTFQEVAALQRAARDRETDGVQR